MSPRHLPSILQSPGSPRLPVPQAFIVPWHAESGLVVREVAGQKEVKGCGEGLGSLTRPPPPTARPGLAPSLAPISSPLATTNALLQNEGLRRDTK